MSGPAKTPRSSSKHTTTQTTGLDYGTQYASVIDILSKKTSSEEAVGKAIKFLQEHCNQDRAEACMTLAGAYAEGRGVKQNLPKSESLHAKSCRLASKLCNIEIRCVNPAKGDRSAEVIRVQDDKSLIKYFKQTEVSEIVSNTDVQWVGADSKQCSSFNLKSSDFIDGNIAGQTGFLTETGSSKIKLLNFRGNSSRSIVIYDEISHSRNPSIDYKIATFSTDSWESSVVELQMEDKVENGLSVEFVDVDGDGIDEIRYPIFSLLMTPCYDLSTSEIGECKTQWGITVMGIAGWKDGQFGPSHPRFREYYRKRAKEALVRAVAEAAKKGCPVPLFREATTYIVASVLSGSNKDQALKDVAKIVANQDVTEATCFISQQYDGRISQKKVLRWNEIQHQLTSWKPGRIDKTLSDTP